MPQRKGASMDMKMSGSKRQRKRRSDGRNMWRKMVQRERATRAMWTQWTIWTLCVGSLSMWSRNVFRKIARRTKNSQQSTLSRFGYHLSYALLQEIIHYRPPFVRGESSAMMHSSPQSWPNFNQSVEDVKMFRTVEGL